MKFKKGIRVITGNGYKGTIIEIRGDKYRVEIDNEFIKDKSCISFSSIFSANNLKIDKQLYRDLKIKKLI